MTQLAAEDVSRQEKETPMIFRADEVAVCAIAKKNEFHYACGSTGEQGNFFSSANSVRELSLEGCPGTKCKKPFGMGHAKCLYTIIMKE